MLPCAAHNIPADSGSGRSRTPFQGAARGAGCPILVAGAGPRPHGAVAGHKQTLRPQADNARSRRAGQRHGARLPDRGKYAGANLRRQTLISVVCQGLLRTHHSLTAKCDGQRLCSAADHGSHLAVLLHIDPDDAAARRRAAAAGQSGLRARTSRVGRPRPAAG